MNPKFIILSATLAASANAIFTGLALPVINGITVNLPLLTAASTGSFAFPLAVLGVLKLAAAASLAGVGFGGLLGKPDGGEEPVEPSGYGYVEPTGYGTEPVTGYSEPAATGYGAPEAAAPATGYGAAAPSTGYGAAPAASSYSAAAPAASSYSAAPAAAPSSSYSTSSSSASSSYSAAAPSSSSYSAAAPASSSYSAAAPASTGYEATQSGYGFRQKRSAGVPSQEDAVFGLVSSMDMYSCGKALICGLKAKDPATHAQDEKLILTLFSDRKGKNVDPKSPKAQYEYAAQLGLATKDEVACRKRYAACPYTTAEMMTAMRGSNF